MHIKKEFTIEPCNEANLVTEAFGIDAGYIQRICDIDIPDEWEVLYITGESGSGKSTILREIVGDYKPEPIPDAPLFLWGGDSEEEQIETLRVLTLVGISDATMFVNTYDRLSDSQQARARIALEIMGGKEVIAIDEFLSTLDRETAYAVAFCIQKAIRKAKKRAVLVTAHNDLEPYLLPDYTITGESFPSRFSISSGQALRENRILKDVRLFYGEKDEYRKEGLGDLHYKGKYTGGTKEYLYAKLRGRTVGVLVSTYRRSDGGRRISRVVVHPSYRGIGIGAKLARKYAEDYPGCDVVAAMGRINPVFDKAGFTRVDDCIIKPPSGLRKDMERHGFDASRWYSRDYCTQFCESDEARAALSRYAKKATALVQPGGAHLKPDEISAKIAGDKKTAGRVLYGLRERRMAKYITATEDELEV